MYSIIIHSEDAIEGRANPSVVKAGEGAKGMKEHDDRFSPLLSESICLPMQNAVSRSLEPELGIQTEGGREGRTSEGREMEETRAERCPLLLSNKNVPFSPSTPL